MLNLSILIVARNEEKNLPRVLANLHFADEIVIVLDRTHDNSKQIAEQHGAKVFEGAWEQEGARRQFGRAQCQYEWILELDADEQLSPEIIQEMQDILPNTPLNGYFQTPILNFVGQRPVRYGWGNSFGVMGRASLSHKDAKIWGSERVHPSLKITGPKRFLQHDIYHFVDDDITDMIKRLNHYATSHAQDWAENPQKADSLFMALYRIPIRFIRCYVKRKGYTESVYGFTAALCASLYPLLSYLKYKEILMKKNIE